MPSIRRYPPLQYLIRQFRTMLLSPMWPFFRMLLPHKKSDTFSRLPLCVIATTISFLL
jgi:hypothetical protein